MRFELVDRIIEQTADRIVTIKAVSAAEEYLADHFPTFPVLPGVMMLEAMVQAARRLASATTGPGGPDGPLVLGRVRALKYGRFVKPGSFLRVEVSLLKPPDGGVYEFRGEAAVILPGGSDETSGVAAAGRFALRPVRLPPAAAVGEGPPAE